MRALVRGYVHLRSLLELHLVLARTPTAARDQQQIVGRFYGSKIFRIVHESPACASTLPSAADVLSYDIPKWLWDTANRVHVAVRDYVTHETRIIGAVCQRARSPPSTGHGTRVSWPRATRSAFSVDNNLRTHRAQNRRSGVDARIS